MGYAEAIEMQMAAVDFLKSSAARELAKTSQDHATHYRLSSILLSHAEPYFVDREIGIFIYENILLDVPLQPTSACGNAGWIFFERGLPVPASVKGVEFDHISAIAFMVIDHGLVIQHFLDTRKLGGSQLFPGPVLDWAWGDDASHHQGEDLTREDVMVRQHALARGVLLAFFAFVGQRIFTTSQKLISNRQARKRAEKKLQHIPLVHVVELRRREYQQRDESHDTPVEWSCQWLVRGHWRQQFFPSTGEHRPLWISPHIKGPNDKPLKAPTITAYEVVR